MEFELLKKLFRTYTGREVQFKKEHITEDVNHSSLFDLACHTYLRSGQIIPGIGIPKIIEDFLHYYLQYEHVVTNNTLQFPANLWDFHLGIPSEEMLETQISFHSRECDEYFTENQERIGEQICRERISVNVDLGYNLNLLLLIINNTNFKIVAIRGIALLISIIPELPNRFLEEYFRLYLPFKWIKEHRTFFKKITGDMDALDALIYQEFGYGIYGDVVNDVNDVRELERAGDVEVNPGPGSELGFIFMLGNKNETILTKKERAKRNRLLMEHVTFDSLKKKRVGLLRAIAELRSNVQARNNLETVALLEEKIATINSRLKNVFDYHNEVDVLGECDCRSVINSFRECEPQMDVQPAESDTRIDADQAGNTTITSATTDTSGEATKAIIDASHVRNLFSDQVHVGYDKTDRWTIIQQTEITTSTAEGILTRINLPIDLLKAAKCTPGFLQFNQYDYFTTDLEIKFQLTTNKFQQIMIQAGVYYHYLERQRPSEVETAAVISQMPHIVLNGNNVNSGILEIPMLSYLPMIPTVDSRQAIPLYFCTVLVRLLHALETGTENSPRCELLVFGRLKNTHFYGQRNFIEVEPQFGIIEKGLGIAKIVGGAANSIGNFIPSVIGPIESLLNAFMPDRNRDKPTNITPVVKMYQTTSTCLATGKGTFETDVFRLDPSSTTNHIPGIVDIGEDFDLLGIAMKWGLIGSFYINQAHTVGTLLATILVNPCLETTIISTNIKFGNGVSWWAPVDHIASMFTYWRGDMEIKLELITDGLKSVRLSTRYLPTVETIEGGCRDSLPTKFIDIGNSLDGKTSFEFVIPYQQLFYMMPTANLGLTVDSTQSVNNFGCLPIYLETPLIVNPNVMNRMVVNVYKRARPNFEVAVPRDCITQFLIDAFTQVGELSLLKKEKHRIIESTGIIIPASFPVIKLSEEPSKQSAYLSFDGKVRLDDTHVFENSILFILINENTVVIQNDQHVLMYENNNHIIIKKEWSKDFKVHTKCYMDVEAQMDVREVSVDHTEEVPVCAKFMNMQIGEDHMDLKTMLRRAEFYTSRTIVNSIIANHTFLRLPVVFGNSVNRDDVGALNVQNRQNKITLLSDTFRYARGTLRYFVHFSDVTDDTLIEVTHVLRGDITATTNEQQILLPPPIGGWASNLYAMSQNRMITIEIPFYMQGNYILNSSFNSETPAINRNTNLGTLYFAKRGATTSSFTVTVWRALGDDTTMSMFNGFPDRQLLTSTIGLDSSTKAKKRVAVKIGKLTAQSEESDPIPANLQLITKELRKTHTSHIGVVHSIKSYKKKYKIVEPNIFGFSAGIFSNEWVEAGKQAKEAFEQVNKLGNNVNNMGFCNLLGKDLGVGAKIASLALRVTQVVLDSSVKNIVLSVTGILIDIGVITYDTIFDFINGLTIWVRGLFCVEPQSDSIADISGLFINLISSYCDVKNYSKKEVPLFNNIFTSIGKAADRNARVVKLIESILLYCRRLYFWFVGHKDPNSAMDELLRNNSGDLKLWFKVVIDITDPMLLDKILADENKCKQVYRLEIIGREYRRLFLGVTRDEFKNVPFEDFNVAYSKLQKLITTIGESKNQPKTRYEPFVVYIHGASGVGKSTIAKQIIKRILIDSMCVSYNGNPVYTRSSGVEYWNGYVGQPAILYDDIYTTYSTDIGAAQANEHMALKSCAVYNPPMADLSDKRRVVTSKLVVMCSNILTPSPSNLLNHDALARRRDILIGVRKREGNQYKPCQKHSVCGFLLECVTCCNNNVGFCLDDFLEFYIYKDVRKPEDSEHSENWINYNTLLGHVVELARAYDIVHQKMYAESLNDLDYLSSEAWSRRSFLPRQEQQNTANIIEEEVIFNDLSKVVNGDTIEPQSLWLTGVCFYGISYATASSLGFVLSKAYNINQAEMDSISEGEIGNGGYYIQPEKGFTFSTSKGTFHTVLIEDDVKRFINCFIGVELKDKYINYLEIGRHILNLLPGYGELPNDNQEIISDFRKVCSLYFHCEFLFNNDLRLSRSSLFLLNVNRKLLRSMEINYSHCLHSLITAKTNYSYVNGEFAWRVEEPDGSAIAPISNTPCSSECVWANGDYRNRVLKANLENVRLSSETSFHLLTMLLKETGTFLDLGKTKMTPYERFCVGVEKFVSKRKITTTLLLLGVQVTLTFLAVRKIKKMYENLFNDDKAEIEPQIFDSSSDHRAARRKAQRKFNVRKPALKGKTMKVEANTGVTVLKDLINRNTYTVSLNIKSSDMSMKILGIGGRVGLINMHSVKAIQEFNKIGSTVRVKVFGTNSGADTIVNIDDFIFHPIDDYDLCVVEIPERLPLFRNIKNHFIQPRMLNYIGKKAHLVDCREGVTTIFSDLPVEEATLDLRYTRDDKAIFEDMFFSMVGYSYPKGGRGLCMSPLIDCNSGKISGLHVAGVSNQIGYALSVTSEDIEQFLSVSNIIDVIEPESNGEEPLMTFSSDYVGIATVDANFAVNYSGKHTIEESSCKGLLIDNYRTLSLLRDPGEVRKGYGPVSRGVVHQLNPTIPFSSSDRDKVEDYLKAKFRRDCKPIMNVKSKRSINDAIVGIPGLVKSLYNDTSAGYPLSLEPGVHGKGWLWNIEDEKVTSLHKKFVEKYRDNNLRRSKGVVPDTIFMCTPKDEKLPCRKFDRTRLINGSPVEYTVTCRQYFMDFNASFMESRFSLQHSVGINPRGLEWTKLYNRLHNNSLYCCSGDYSKFGPTLDSDCVRMAYRIINDWYSYHHQGMDNNIRNVLAEEAVNALNIAGDNIYRTLCGSPSGHIMTVIINSIVNLIYMHLAWLDLLRDTSFSDFNSFNKLVELFVYGDDLIMTVKDIVLDKFNNETLSFFFKRFNITYTDTMKDGSIRRWMPLIEATYLKMAFVSHPARKGVYMPGLCKEVILDQINWRSKGFLDPTDIEMSVCENACRDSWGWGEEFFQDVYNPIYDHWQSRGFKFPLLTWEILDNYIYNDDVVCSGLYEYFSIL